MFTYPAMTVHDRSKVLRSQTHTQHNTNTHTHNTTQHVHTHIAFFAVRQQARNPLFWQSQFASQGPFGEYFCCLSCPSTLPTVLIVLVWFSCVSVPQIARTKLTIAFFAVCQGTRNPLFWQSQFASQGPYGEYFCCLSCPSTLPTVLIVLVWFSCVSVLQIARTKLKFAFFGVFWCTYFGVFWKDIFWQISGLGAIRYHCASITGNRCS